MFTPLPFLPLIVLLVLCAYSLATCRLQLQVVKGTVLDSWRTIKLNLIACLKLAYYHLIVLLKGLVPSSLRTGGYFRLSISPGTGAFKFGNWELLLGYPCPQGLAPSNLGPVGVDSMFNIMLTCSTVSILFHKFNLLDIAIERKCIALYGYFLVM
ncbi:hypothetical protein F4604DRAFT_1684971 [Suillus subluteus]|nr:hypothetical protein F4604DRAFT_1684971 [Suillus subluteus]